MPGKVVELAGLSRRLGRHVSKLFTFHGVGWRFAGRGLGKRLHPFKLCTGGPLVWTGSTWNVCHPQQKLSEKLSLYAFNRSIFILS